MAAPRPLSADNREWLLGELAVWQEAQLVNKDDAQKILGLYELAAEEQQRQHHWFLVSLGGLAALMMFAAAALLVSYNWQAISGTGKLAIVFGTLLATYGIAAAFWRNGYQRVSEVVIFFAGLFYGAAIWLIAQVFHMEAHYPDGYFWWAVGVLPLALIFDTLLLHALFAVLVSAWVGTEIVGYRHFGAFLFGSRWPIANGAYLAPLLIVPGMWLAYRRSCPFRISVYLPALVFWICLQPTAWHWYTGAANFIGAVGALLLILGESHFPKSRMAIPYRLFGAILFGSALIPLSYHNYYSWMRPEPASHAVFLTLIIASLTALTVAAAEFMRYRSLEQGDFPRAFLFADIRQRQWLPLSLAAVMAALALLMVFTRDGDRTSDANLASALLANVAMVALAIWLMRVGVRDNRGSPFAAGVTYFLLWMILRYSDLFGFEAGMLGAAALFAACGVSIGGLAWFWQKRNGVLHVES